MPAHPGWRRPHLVNPEVARLFHALAQPGRQPPAADPLALARLVLDGILEVAAGERFLSGPAAHARLGFPSDRDAREGDTVIGRLSHRALQHAAGAGVTDPRFMSRFLYRYNTLPASAAWYARFPTDAAVTRIYSTVPIGRSRRWTGFVTAPEAGVSWRAWDRVGATIPAGTAPTYKLYVSPLPELVGEACRALLALGQARRGRPFAVKAGNNLASILRSEKLVAYFLTRDELFEAGARLAKPLGGMPAQGVPFTAELSGNGLISWGVDPGTDAEPPGPLRQLSWRRWITARLASALANVLTAGAEVSPVQFTLDRVSLDGVDVVRWTAPGWFASVQGPDAHH